jgi:hypothetical protein
MANEMPNDTAADEQIDLSALADDELVKQMHDDPYDEAGDRGRQGRRTA